MFGIEMIFKAMGFDDAAIAELRALLDPVKIKALFAVASQRWEKLEKDVQETRAMIEALQARQGMSEIIAHGGQVLHPNFEKALNDQLLNGALTYDDNSNRDADSAGTGDGSDGGSGGGSGGGDRPN